MDRISLIRQAEELIQKERFRGCIKGHVCFWKGTLNVYEPNHTALQHVIFFQLKYEHFARGLSAAEWSQLESDLWTFFKEKI